MKQDIKKGDKVIMVNCFEAKKNEGKSYVCESDPVEISGTLCVMLSGRKSYFSCECLKKIN